MTVKEFSDIINEFSGQGLSEKAIVDKAAVMGILRTSSKGKNFTSGVRDEEFYDALKKMASEKNGEESSASSNKMDDHEKGVHETTASRMRVTRDEEDDLDDSDDPAPAHSEEGEPTKQKDHIDLLSWDDAHAKAIRGGGRNCIGIIGLRGTGKTAMLRELDSLQSAYGKWKLRVISEEWQYLGEKRFEKTQDKELEKLEGKIVNEDSNESLQFATIETSGEIWKWAFHADNTIKEDTTAQIYDKKISEVREFVCSCRGFIFLIDAPGSRGLTREGEYDYSNKNEEKNKALEHEIEYNDTDGASHREAVNKLWRGLTRVLARFDSENAAVVERPIAITLTKADIPIVRHWGKNRNHHVFDEDYFLLGDLCKRTSREDYLKNKNDPEKQEARKDRALQFLKSDYEPIYYDSQGLPPRLRTSDIFAIACPSKRFTEEQGDPIEPACVEDAVDWVADRVYELKVEEARVAEAEAQAREAELAEQAKQAAAEQKRLEAEQIKQAKKAATERIKRKAVVTTTTLIILLLIVSGGLYWHASHHLSRLSQSIQTSKTEDCIRSLERLRINPVFKWPDWLLFTKTLKEEFDQSGRDVARLIKSEVLRLTAESEYQNAFELLALANATLDKENEDIIDLSALAARLGRLEIEDALRSGSDDAIALALSRFDREGYLDMQGMIPRTKIELHDVWRDSCIRQSKKDPQIALQQWNERPVWLRSEQLSLEDRDTTKQLRLLCAVDQILIGNFSAARHDIQTSIDNGASAETLTAMIIPIIHSVNWEDTNPGGFEEAISLIRSLHEWSERADERVLIEEIWVSLTIQEVLEHLEQGAPQKASRTLAPAQDSWSKGYPEITTLKSLVRRAEKMVFVEGTNGTPALYVNRNEVSIAQFNRFLNESEGIISKERVDEIRGDWQKLGIDREPEAPAVAITWEEANRFARHYGCRLPTRKQWFQFFGRNDFPWGMEWEDSRANTREARIGRPLPPNHVLVRSDVNSLGIHGLAGNVSEWIYSFDQEGEDSSRVAAGGNFRFDRNEADRASGHALKNEHHEFVGFRTVLSFSRLSSLAANLAISHTK